MLGLVLRSAGLGGVSMHRLAGSVSVLLLLSVSIAGSSAYGQPVTFNTPQTILEGSDFRLMATGALDNDNDTDLIRAGVTFGPSTVTTTFVAVHRNEGNGQKKRFMMLLVLTTGPMAGI